ncbi:protein NLP7-like isoform X2 [Rhododendron vialii]|uniref:protein NLP7-like isoform X2 n=1 Tax=Rhododendron vialii TaxID=182163 RepID=UPI00265F870F|nr:protein NLP7-like isoform X2 [Rhododendron vialii]
MGMRREYNNKFYADAKSEEEQLGLLGRVFLNKLPESTPYVELYTLKEYPQRDLAVRCKIGGSWAVPVFEHSSHTCVGVLEFVSRYNMSSDWFDKQFPGCLYDIFQEFGLLCFDGYKHYKMQNGDKNKARTAAFQELEMICESVCKIHYLPLALAWASCHSCDNLLQSQYQLADLEYVDLTDLDSEDLVFYSYLRDFVNASKFYHLRKGQVSGRILQFHNLLYCSDVKQFSIAESPLVPYARLCKLDGWFTMCLQSSHTGDELYVLEFFLQESEENDENILTKLRLILGTMEEYFETFKLASGQKFGEEVLSLEVIDFQNYQRSHSIHMIPATRSIPSLELLEDGSVILQQGQLDQPSMDAINNGMYVVTEAQNDNLHSLDSLQNGKVTTQVDSSNQPSMDASSNGQNVVIAERNIFVVSSSKEHERKTQDRKHKKGGPRIDIPKEEILKCTHMNREDAAEKLRVGISTFKRVCRGHGIDRWPPCNIEKIQPSLPSSVENQRQTPQLNFDFPSNQASSTVANIKTGFQDADTVTIRATCETDTIKFRLSLSSTLEELQQQVAKRLELKAGTYRIKYKDEKDELILIALDVDLQDCIQCFRSQGNNDIYITLEKKLLNSF